MFPVNTDPNRELVGFLVRHGELNIGNQWDGWGFYDLSPEGLRSAEHIGQWLSFEKIGRIISSDLPRTIQTAEIIMNSCNVACPYLATDPNLRAWAIGNFTGKEKNAKNLKEFQFYRDNIDTPIPDGESYQQLCDRVQVVYQYLGTPYNALPTVLVVHNSVLKALLNLDEAGEVVMPGGIVAVFMNEKGECVFDAVLGAPQVEESV